MTTAEYLREMRKLIEKPENWCQGEYARDANGNRVHDGSGAATRWCALGSYWKVRYSHPEFETTPLNLLAKAATQRGVQGVADFNDSHTHEEVLALFDEAIAEAEKVG